MQFTVSALMLTSNYRPICT